MAIGLPLRKYLDDDLEIPDDLFESNVKERPVQRNDTYRMLGHILRVTAVIGRSGQRGVNYENEVFLTCTDDCNCCDKFAGKLIWPVKLRILERHLEKVTLDKF